MWVSWILIFRTPMVTPWDLQWLGTSQMQSGVGSPWERFLSRAKMEMHWFPSAMWLCQGLRQDWGVVSTVRKENAQRLWATCGLARPNLCVAILHLLVLIESPFCVSWRAGILKVVLHVAVVRPTWTNRRANAPNCISQGWQICYHWILGGALSSSDLMWYKYPSNLFKQIQRASKVCRKLDGLCRHRLANYWDIIPSSDALRSSWDPCSQGAAKNISYIPRRVQVGTFI